MKLTPDEQRVVDLKALDHADDLSKATPRPWQLVDIRCKLSVCDKRLNYIAHMVPQHPNFEAELRANAELIVRAVNAYDGLVALAHHVLECGKIQADGTIGIHETAYLHEKARQCLKLAEGE